MNKINRKRGMALLLALVFAVVLLQMALAYSKMTGQSKPQTIQIDERIKLDFLAHSLTELALLKFQMFTADYYAAQEAAEKGDSSHLLEFTTGSPEFTILNYSDSKSSFNQFPINIQLATMTILTDNKWKTEALMIQAAAAYTDQLGRNISKDAVRLVSIERRINK